MLSHCKYKKSKWEQCHLFMQPCMALPPSLPKGPQIANKLSVVLFSFDSFSEYPLSIIRRNLEKRSKAVVSFCSFPKIDGKKPELFTKNSYLDGKWRIHHASPLKSESGYNYIQIVGGRLMYYQLNNKIYLEIFSKPDNRCPGRGLSSFSENDEGRISV